MKPSMVVAPLLVVILLLSSSLAILVQKTEVLQTPSGQVQGIIQDGVQQYLGVPFALPPVGSLRWKAPVLKTSWEGILSASNYAPSCMQSSYGQPNLKMSEDCLYLNIFVPGNSTPTTPLPVRVWIYGGGYQLGSTTSYPAAPLTSLSNSIIVTISYRVGVFGFFGLPQLIKESPVLNYGLQDQQAALTWINKNIASYGGDRNNILIFGESAGGSSVAMHLLMKASWPLYQKAILESPGPWRFPSLDLELRLSEGLAATVPSCNSSSDLLGCMRGLSAQSLLNAWMAAPQFIFGSLPCIDGQQILDVPARLFSAGKMNPNVPLILGSNYAEGNFLAFVQVLELYNTTQLNITEQQYNTLVAANVPPSYIPTVTSWYDDIARYQGYWQALSHIFADLMINTGTYLVGLGAMKAGNPLYRYVFAEDTVHSVFSFLNATHGSEMPYVFANPDIFNATSFTPSEWAVSKQIVSYWTNFHKTGNPNGGGAFHWPRFLMGFYHIIELQDNPNILNGWDTPYVELWSRILLSGQ